jgi:hypothetical protein
VDTPLFFVLMPCLQPGPEIARLHPC